MKTRLLLAASAALIASLVLGACGQGPTTPDPGGPPIDQAVDQAASARPAASQGVTVAEITHDGVAIHAAPDPGSAVTVTLDDHTPLGSPTTLLVLDEQPGWLQVALPTRPNGSTGWVAEADVETSVDDVAITVSLADHVLRVARDGELAVETPVAVGAPGTPTPTGRFFVTDVVDTGKPQGAYGPFALGLSAHSDVLDQFAGGDGQIGVHGTNEPDAIGQSASHGCVRVPNEVIVALASSVPLGTPVTIS